MWYPNCWFTVTWCIQGPAVQPGGPWGALNRLLRQGIDQLASIEATEVLRHVRIGAGG